MNAPTSVPMTLPSPPRKTAAADDDRRDCLEFVAFSGGRLSGHQTRCFNHSGESGQQSADRINRGRVKRNRNAGIKSSIGIAADCERVPSEFRVLHDDVDQQRTHQQNPEHEGNAEQIAFAEIRNTLSGCCAPEVRSK